MPINKNVFIAAAIISLGFLTKEVIDTQNNARKAAPNTQQTISAAAEKMQQMNDDPSKKAALFTLSGAEKNTDDVLANLSKQYINAILIQSNQYHEAYQKLGFSTLLSGKRLLKDKDMRESYSILNQAKTLSQAQITRFDEIQQVNSGAGNCPTIFGVVLHFQPVRLGHRLKSFVVIHAVIAGVLDGFGVAVRVEDF